MQIIKCASIGKSHIKANLPCQDKVFSYNSPKTNTHIIALADGAGSAKLSHIGAEICTKLIVSNLKNNFEKYFNNPNAAKIKRAIINRILSTLTIAAQKYNCQLRDLASTLLCVAVKNENFIMLHIGDGIIGYLKNDELYLASSGENGEFANTTFFTTTKNVSMQLKKGDLGAINGFILMSDGAQESLFDKKNKYLAPILKSILERAKNNPILTQKALQHSFDTIIKDKTKDDCSICIMVKK